MPTNQALMVDVIIPLFIHEGIEALSGVGTCETTHRRTGRKGILAQV